MFEKLSQLPRPTTTSAVHYAMRLMLHRNSYPRDEHGRSILRREGLPSEPSREEKEIALSLLKEIGAHENLPIGDDVDDYSAAAALSEAHVRIYANALYQALIESFGPSTEEENQRGRQLLQELREQYATVGR